MQYTIVLFVLCSLAISTYQQSMFKQIRRLQDVKEEFKLTSPEGGIVADAEIDSKFCKNNKNLSPTLNWSNPPEKTLSFAISVIDLDQDENPGILWEIVDIPAHVASIPEACKDAQCGGRQIMNSSDTTYTYEGPVWSTGTHNIQFTVYALSKPLVWQEANNGDTFESYIIENGCQCVLGTSEIEVIKTKPSSSEEEERIKKEKEEKERLRKEEEERKYKEALAEAQRKAKPSKKDDKQLPNGGGGWGGYCLCPSGAKYPAGDVSGTACREVACTNGKTLSCHHRNGEWSGKSVKCSTDKKVPKVERSSPAPELPPAEKHNHLSKWSRIKKAAKKAQKKSSRFSRFKRRRKLDDEKSDEGKSDEGESDK